MLGKEEKGMTEDEMVGGKQVLFHEHGTGCTEKLCDFLMVWR